MRRHRRAVPGILLVAALTAVPVGLAQIPIGNPTDELPPVPNTNNVQPHVMDCAGNTLTVGQGTVGSVVRGSEATSWVPYWLGPDFETPDPGVVGQNSMTLYPSYAEARCMNETTQVPFAQDQSVVVYGSCDPYSDYTAPSPTSDTTNLPEPGGCLPPVQVESGPYSQRNYTLYKDGPDSTPYPYTATTATANNYPAASFDDGTIIEVYVNQGTTVSITGADPATVRKAADSIVRIPSKDWVPDVKVCVIPSPGHPCIVGLPGMKTAAKH